jgi:outer membrane receptor protein involved in Fe transport
MRKLTLSVSGVCAAFVTIPAMLVSSATYAQALEEITVTARKTAENLQEVPLSITAIGAEEIDRLGIKDLTGITQLDTSVQFDEGFTPSDTRITIRGLSPTRGRPNAATLVDGIDVTSEAVSNAGGSLLINPRLIDIERIEIVKGPQSALYGRSAFAGAIQYVTKDPADELSGELYVDANSEDAQELRGNVSIPINDELGVLINGLVWDAEGSYRNIATGDHVGGGDGFGTSVTVKWEPSDELSLKWRTEYSDDNFDVAPQVLLNDRNKYYDLGRAGNLNGLLGKDNPLNGRSNLAPASSNCIGGTGPGTPGSGPLDNNGCLETAAFTTFFNDGNLIDPAGALKNLGQYDAADVDYFNQYNKQVVSLYKGKFPDADELQVALSPNYQYGIGAIDPARAKDYDGVDKEVWRTSLVADWAYSDTLTFTSYTSYLDSTVDEALDIGKFYKDDCSADVDSIREPGTDPLGGGGSYADALIAEGFADDDAVLAAFAPCNDALGGDGINDSSTAFAQNSSTDTKQLSQEFRGSWDISESVNFTTGLLYWHEEVSQFSHNSVTIMSGPECYLQNGRDSSQIPPDQTLVDLNDIQDQCGNTNLAVAYWAAETYQGRLIQPDTTDRDTDHYSWYGSLDLDLTEKFVLRMEARFTREENEITGLVQNPCLNPDDRPGDEGCTTAGGGDRTEVGAGGQPTGPSAVLLCGQVGRCDRLGIAPVSGSPYYGQTPQAEGAYSWWDWGYLPMPGNYETIDKTDRFWAPKATLEYFWNDDVMTYFSWSRGIKPGGFSLLTSGAFGLDANLDGNYEEIDYDNERLDVWEVGAKTTLFDGRVRLNGAVFYQDFKDKQVTVQAVVANTVGTKVENISGSEVRGLEVDGSWQVTENILFSAGYTYLDSEYTDYTIVSRSANDIARIALGNGDDCNIELIAGADPASAGSYGCEMSFNGNELERAPKHALLANLNYTNNLFETGYEWFGEASWRYQDSRYVEAFNIVEFRAYNLTDFRAGILADYWDVTFFLDNAFDDDTIITGGPNPGIPTGSFGFGLSVPPFPPGINAGPKLPSDAYAQLPNPRTAGIRASFRFGQ